MKRIISSDFDRTIAQTFTPRPGGIGVVEASARALDQLLGSDFGHRAMCKIREPQRLAPRELVEQAIRLGNRTSLMNSARSFIATCNGSLEQYVPVGKGIPLKWNEMDPFPVLTETFVRLKLSHLMDQIGGAFDRGDLWPLPCPGFLEFWKAFLELKTGSCAKDDILDFGIISSGHDKFIERCFHVWGVQCTELMVTDDDMRSEAYAKFAPEERAKPHRMVFDALCRKLPQPEFFHDHLHKNGNAVHVGDSLCADGGLAKNLNIPFVWFDPHEELTGSPPDIFPVTDWKQLLPLLEKKSLAMLRKGLPLSQVLRTILNN